MAGFYGEYRRKLNRGRVNVPAGFRMQLPEKLVISESIGGDCLWLMGDEDYDAWLAGLFEARFGGYDPSNRTQTMLRSSILAKSLPCKMGQSGSLGIPAELRERLKLGDTVVLVGVSDRIEIWDPDTWDSAQAQLDAEAILGEHAGSDTEA